MAGLDPAFPVSNSRGACTMAAGDFVDMQQWYFESAGQSVGPMGTDALKQAVLDGRLRPETSVWTDGMAHWQPASQTDLANQIPVLRRGPPPLAFAQSIQAPQPTYQPHPYRSIAGLSSIASGGLLVLAFIAAIQAAFVMIGIASSDSLLTLALNYGMPSGSTLSAVVVIALHVSSVVLAILFLVWIHMAVSNLHSIGAVPPLTPGMAVGWFFIPVANVWQPILIMQMLNLGSRGRSGWLSIFYWPVLCLSVVIVVVGTYEIVNARGFLASVHIRFWYVIMSIVVILGSIGQVLLAADIAAIGRAQETRRPGTTR